MDDYKPPQRYKIGDRVKYKNRKDSLTFLVGKVFTISEIKWKDLSSWWGYKVHEDSSWLFDEKNLMLVYEGECEGCTSSCKGEKRCGLYESEGEGRGGN